jgi:site-specific DNA-methyltransferase (adenine-specific)
LNYELKLGDNVVTLKQYPDNHFDSIVTDPPYGIEFLGKDWDKNTGAIETWNECYRVLKPGGHILAFSAARTYHHLATNIETAGFEIRDQLMWLYGSGFPKAQDIGKSIDKRAGKKDPNYGTDKTSVGVPLEGEYKGGQRCNKCNKTIGTWIKDCKEEDCGQKYNYQTEEAKQWAGWKTALKPAHEPIVMARKPFNGSTIDNVLEHGVGAMNIDESRVSYADEKPVTTHSKKAYKSPSMAGEVGALETHSAPGQELGRYPSNVIMDEVAGQMLDEQAPKSGNVSSSKRTKTGMTGSGHSLAWHKNAGESNGISDGLSGASKFFYCPKVSRTERHIGFEQTQENKRPRGEAFGDGNLLTDQTKSLGNNHPTVKPVELMKYLVKLVTPKGGKVLDPFNGSGSTGMACVELEYEYTGCELDPEYIEIATKRIEGWYEYTRPDNNFDSLFDEE